MASALSKFEIPSSEPTELAEPIELVEPLRDPELMCWGPETPALPLEQTKGLFFVWKGLFLLRVRGVVGVRPFLPAKADCSLLAAAANSGSVLIISSAQN